MLVYRKVVPIVDGTSPLCQSTRFVGTVTWGAACNSWPNYFQCWPLSTVRSSPIPTVVYTQYHGKVCLVALGLPESMNKHLFGLEWRSYGIYKYVIVPIINYLFWGASKVLINALV